MENVFENAAQKVKNSRIVIWVFIASFAMLLIGANHFWEDTLSSYYGIKMLEESYGLKPTTYDLTYWTMSFAPQIAQVVLAYIYMSNPRKNRWALLGVIVALFFDFFADTWYRSDSAMFNSVGTAVISILLTFIYFTIGSELFITIGLGLTLELAPPFFVQGIDFFDQLFDSIANRGRKLRGGGMKPQAGKNMDFPGVKK